MSGCMLNRASMCGLSTCVKKIQGLKSDSLSPSDTWIIKFQDGTKYEDELGRKIDIPEAFCKLSIDSTSLRHWLDKFEMPKEMTRSWNSRLEQLQGLEYERWFYETVVNDILDTRKSPHFVRLFSSGNKCSFQDLVTILKRGGVSYAENSLMRNLYYTFRTEGARPAITSIIPGWPTDLNKFNFSFMLIQKMDSDYGTTFDRWIEKNSKTKTFMQDLRLILFQVCQACYALFLKDACHNDLRPGNVWIATRPREKRNIKYIVRGQEFIFPQVDIMVRIFDFDRAYSAEMGPNLLLTDDVCMKNGHCNRVIQPADFIKFLCYVTRHVDLKKLFFNFSATERGMQAFNMLRTENSCFFTNPPWDDNTLEKSGIGSYDDLLFDIWLNWRGYGSNKIAYDAAIENIIIDESFVLNDPQDTDSPSFPGASSWPASQDSPKNESIPEIQLIADPEYIKLVKDSDFFIDNEHQQYTIQHWFPDRQWLSDKPHTIHTQIKDRLTFFLKKQLEYSFILVSGGYDKNDHKTLFRGERSSFDSKTFKVSSVLGEDIWNF